MADDEDSDEGVDPGKAGLKAAIDATKYTLTIAGAAIAFLVSSDTVKTITSCYAKITVTLALLAFGVSAIGGLLVLLQGATGMANNSYDLSQPALKYPGMANIIGLIAGFLFATIFVISAIWT